MTCVDLQTTPLRSGTVVHSIGAASSAEGGCGTIFLDLLWKVLHVDCLTGQDIAHPARLSSCPCRVDNCRPGLCGLKRCSLGSSFVGCELVMVLDDCKPRRWFYSGEGALADTLSPEARRNQLT